MAQSATPDTEADDVQEIIVTGQKREENLQDVSAAISVIGGDSLDDRSIAKVEDLQRIAPALTVTNSGLTQNVNIRGIGLASANANASNGVATYIDGMFQPPVVTTTSFYDINSVEVFRGPQGTFVGSNSTGGAVFINTQSPILGEGEGYAQVTVGNFNALLKGELNQKETEGYAWQPGPLTRYAALANSDPYLLSYSNETRNSERNFQTTLRLNYITSGGVTFRSLSGFTSKRIWNFYDQDATNSTTLPRSAQFQHVNEREITQEFNILSPEGARLSWVIGGYYQQNLVDVTNNNFVNGNNNTTNIYVIPDKRTKGVFAQVTVPLNDQISIDVGARHSWFSNESTGTVSLGNGTVVGNPGGSHKDKKMTGKVAINWKPNDDNLVYAFVARGYKPGGIQRPASRR